MSILGHNSQQLTNEISTKQDSLIARPYCNPKSKNEISPGIQTIFKHIKMKPLNPELQNSIDGVQVADEKQLNALLPLSPTFPSKNCTENKRMCKCQVPTCVYRCNISKTQNLVSSRARIGYVPIIRVPRVQVFFQGFFGGVGYPKSY